jgi:hypothetical protein
MTNTIDKIGLLRAQIDTLQSELKSLEDAVKDEGPGRYEGDLYAATVSDVWTNRTAWKAVCERLGASRQLITAHTKRVHSVRLDVRARGAAARVAA